MAKPSKKATPVPETTQPAIRKGKQINAWIESRLRDAFDAMVDAHRPKGTLTGHLETAIEEYLEKHGYWPPPET